MIPELPSVELTNGIVVANYSSPHTFLFEDDSVLPKCTDERALLTKLKDNEREVSRIMTIKSNGKAIDYSNITLEWELSWYVQDDLLNIMKAWIDDKLEWDLIIVPLPVLLAWKKYRDAYTWQINKQMIPRGPFVAVRLVDRLEPKRVSINKFCV